MTFLGLQLPTHDRPHHPPDLSPSTHANTVLQVIESCPATAALQRHIDELFGPVDKNDCSDLVLTSQESYLHMVTEAER